MSLRDDITRAINEAGIEGFSFVHPTRWEAILHLIAGGFLIRGVRDLECVWMYDRFRNVVSAVHPDDSLAYLREQLEPDREYWFLASDEHGKYWVADATGDGIMRTIGEMYCFEYYVVDRHLEWILCESHHDVFIKATAIEVGKGEAQEK